MPADLEKIKSVIESDVKFLRRHGIMDYSLLLSAEKFTAGSIRVESGELLDGPSPAQSPSKAEHAFQTSLNDNMAYRSSGPRHSKTFFQRANISQQAIMSRDDLNEYLATRGVTDGQFNRHVFLSANGEWIYHVSIIDYLQSWNFEKKGEAFAKTWLLGKKSKGISAVEPEFYAKRFLRFMFQHVFVDKRHKRTASIEAPFTAQEEILEETAK